MDNVEMAMVHGNQWVCDCHVRYVASWLLSNKFPSNSKPKCATPEYLANVSLVELQPENCENRHWLINDVIITNTSSSSVSLSWQPRRKSPDFITTHVFSGRAHGENGLDQRLRAESLMIGDSISRDLVEDETIEIKNLTSNATYVMCVCESDQIVERVLASQCFTVRTKIKVYETSKESDDRGHVNLILVIVVSFLLTSSLAAVFYYVKRSHELKRENPHDETDSIQYYEAAREKKVSDEGNYLVPRVSFAERVNHPGKVYQEGNYLTPIFRRSLAENVSRETAYMVISTSPRAHVTTFRDYDVIQPTSDALDKNVQSSSGNTRFVV